MGSAYGRGGDKEAALANVALLYYGQGLTQSEIAKRLQVSRVTVVNMLRETRETGIVEVRVNGRALATSTLARDLKKKFGLQDAYVAVSGMDTTEPNREINLMHVAQVGAVAFLEIVSPGDRVGVAWGEMISAVSHSMSRQPLADVEVCQLIGSMVSKRVAAAESSAIRIAAKLGATCFTLHAPGIVASREIAEVLKDEPTIKAQLERLQALDMAMFSIGDVSDNTHFAVAGMATLEEVKAARTAGAVGVLCCLYIDAMGNHVELPPSERLIAADLPALKQAGKRLLVVAGTERAKATRAALKGGFVTHLCVDHALAKALLAVD